MSDERPAVEAKSEKARSILTLVLSAVAALFAFIGMLMGKVDSEAFQSVTSFALGAGSLDGAVYSLSRSWKKAAEARADSLAYAAEVTQPNPTDSAE